MADFKVYKNFIEEEHRLSFLKDIQENLHNFNKNPNGPFREFLRIDNTPIFNDIHNLYLSKIVDCLGLNEVRIDPMLGILYSNISKGGFIHLHIDSYPPYDTKEYVNYRFNLMLNRGTGEEYNPVVENVGYEVNAGDAWSFSASLYEHETKSLFEDTPRIVLQYGFMLDKKQYKNLNGINLTDRMKEYYAKNSRNGIARSRKDFFGQSAEIVPGI